MKIDDAINKILEFELDERHYPELPNEFWKNEEYERTNSVGIDFKENSFESKFFLSSKSKDFTAIGQFKNDKIDVKIK